MEETRFQRPAAESGSATSFPAGPRRWRDFPAWTWSGVARLTASLVVAALALTGVALARADLLEEGSGAKADMEVVELGTGLAGVQPGASPGAQPNAAPSVRKADAGEDGRAAAAPPPPVTRLLDGGEASFYHPSLEGRPTASGEAYRGARLTAAHRTLPFGSKVRVTHASNQRSVVVVINDRGPFAKRRVIDLSRAAAEKLGMTRQGRAQVRIELLTD